MNTSPKVVGEKSEGMVLAALLRAGKVVLQPFGDNQRYARIHPEGRRVVDDYRTRLDGVRRELTAHRRAGGEERQVDVRK